MNKYRIVTDLVPFAEEPDAAWTFEIEAENEEDARKKGQEFAEANGALSIESVTLID
jgi:hypothetical protein